MRSKVHDIWQKLNPSGFVFRYYLATFFSGLMFYVSVLVPFYTEWGHLNLTQVQFLQSWLMIWMFVLNIPTGALADHLGRKVSVSLGGFILAISSVVYVLIPNFYLFLFAEFLAALGTSFVVGASSALVYDYLKRSGRDNESKKVLARSSSFSNLGTIVAAPVGSLIAAQFGLRAPMIISAIPLFIAAIVILTVDEPKTQKVFSRHDLINTSKMGISILLKNKTVLYLIASDILVWIGAYFLIWLYQPMLVKVGLAIIYFGFIRSAFSLAATAATFNIHITERIFGSEKNFVNLTAIIVSATLIFIAIYPSVVTVVIAIILVGGLASTRSSFMNTTMNEFIPAEQRATILSATSTLKTLVFAIANPMVGFAADHSLRLTFLLIGFLPLIAFFLLPYSLKLKEHLPKTEPLAGQPEPKIVGVI